MGAKEWWMEELAMMRNRAEAAETALAERDKPCVWTHIDVGWYRSSCGSDYFEVIGKFCTGCGRPIEVIEDAP